MAVLAHELGHFKLNHIRVGLVRSVLMTGAIFYLLSLALDYHDFYMAFQLYPQTHHGPLFVFFMWFGLIDFFLQPVTSYLSRRNEFAADKFALEHTDDKRELGAALVKLRERNHAMPLADRWYSNFYYSHPPILERLKAMSYL